MFKSSSFSCLVAYFLAFSATISTMLWSVRPAVAWTAKHHRRIPFSSLASTASRLAPDSYNTSQQYRSLHTSHPLSIGAASRHYSTTTIATKRFMVSNDNSNSNEPVVGDVRFKQGDEVQVEIVQFGPLGASVEVIGIGHADNVPLLPADAPEAYGYGLILQKEISYFRNARDNIDVVRGEILPAYIQNVREEDGKLDISLRSYGGKAKSTDAGTQILERLQDPETGGRLEIGEKSTPQEINYEFPGVSKSVFKKALGGLYKKGLVQPGKHSIELMKK